MPLGSKGLGARVFAGAWRQAELSPGHKPETSRGLREDRMASGTQVLWARTLLPLYAGPYESLSPGQGLLYPAQSYRQNAGGSPPPGAAPAASR